MDTGDDLDEVPDDAAEFIEEMKRRRELEEELEEVAPEFIPDRRKPRRRRSGR